MKPRELAFKVRDDTLAFVETRIEELMPECDRRFSADERIRMLHWVKDHLASTLAIECERAGYNRGR